MHCGHPEHEHGAEEMMARVEAACARQGLRLTPMRRKVFALLAARGRPVKAYDLMELVRADSGSPVAPPTVYRALEFLIANAFVHRLEAINAFIPCPHPEDGGHRSQFLVCERCLETRELDDPGIAAGLAGQAEQLGFLAHRHTVEVYGLCASCRGAH